jgi:cobalamin biosynthetic protein CobC
VRVTEARGPITTSTARLASLPTAAVDGPAFLANGIALEESSSLDVAVRFATTAPARSVTTLVNPNNPDGLVIPREQLLALHDVVASRDGYLVVDEAFADVEPACSVAVFAGSARYNRLVVLRSFGKFYGLAGVRLGFIIAAPSMITRFRELLGDWPVSADAIAAGIAAYADDAWAQQTRERLLHSARRLDDLLISSGLDIVGGTTLFRLARSSDARARFEKLLRAGILARPFDHDATLLRFGLPHDASAWQRLAEALRTP